MGSESTPDAAPRGDDWFAAVFRQSPIGMEIYDAHGRLTDANPACLDLFGVVEVQAIRGFDLFADPNVSAADKAALKAGHAVRYQAPFDFGKVHTAGLFRTTRTGIMWLDVLIAPLAGANGERTGYQVQVQDITLRVAAEAELEQERSRLAGIIAATRVGTWEWNVQTGETRFNERWAEIAGYALDELAPVSIATWTRLVHPDDVRRSDEQLRRHLAGELASYALDCRMRHKQGRWVWVHDTGEIVQRDGDGRPLWMYGTHTDITDRKTAEHESQVNLALQRVRIDILNMAAESDWQRVIGRIEAELRVLLPFNVCSVNVFADDGTSVMTWATVGGGWHPVQRWHRHPVFALAATTGEPVYRPTRRDPLFDPDIDPTVNAVVDVPFRGGTLAVNSTREHPFDAGDLALLQRFAALLSEAHVRLVDLRTKARVAAELAQRDATLQLLAASTHDWVYWQRQDGGLEYMSDSTEEITGYPAAAFVADPHLLERVIHAQDRDASAARLRAAMATEETLDLEFRLLHRAGHVVWISHGSQPLHDRAGACVGRRVINRDITARRQRELNQRVDLALQRLRTQIVGMAEAADLVSVVQVLDRELRPLLAFQGCSVNLVDAHGHRLGYYVPADRAAPQPGTWNPHPVFALATATGQPVYRRTRQDPLFEATMPPMLHAVVDVPFLGGTLAVNSTVENAFDDGDLALLQRFAAVLSEASQRHRDLLARQEVEAALRNSEERFRRMFEAHHAIMLLVSPDDGRIVAANPAAAEFYGYEQRALEAMRIFDLNTESMAEVTAAMAAIRAQRRQAYSFGHRLAGGEVRQVEVRSSPVEVAGEVLLFSIVNDVTERQRMERELEAQRLRVAEADRLQALGEMAAGVAHEINQPLNGIRAFAEATLIGLDRGWSLEEAQVREALGDIVSQVDRISDIIDHMRSFARGHDDVGDLPLALDEVVAGALKLIGSSLRTQGIEVRVEIEPGVTCRGWSNRLEQVLLNLLANARDALAARLVLQRTGDPAIEPDWRPGVWISARRSGADGPARLSVADNAGGIPPALLPRIFEPFYTTKPVGQGTGIGLAVVQSIVQQHWGTIEVDNQPGQGVTFTAVLPYANSRRAAPTLPVAAGGA